MDFPTVISERFDFIIGNYKNAQERNELKFIDKAIWYVVSVRSEADINGSESVFEQLFENDIELRNFSKILGDLNEPDLQNSFSEIAEILSRYNFWNKSKRSFDIVAEKDRTRIAEVMNDIDRMQSLWNLDKKLANYLNTNVR